MKEDVLRQLRISQEFQRLAVPMSREETLRLERELLSGQEPPVIVVWNDYILDGYTQYELCQKHGLLFRLDEKSFSCQEAAISWICCSRLGQERLTVEMRRFLIGTRYIAENRLKKTSHVTGSADMRDSSGVTGRRLAARIGGEYGVSLGSVERYARYTRALERMRSHVPALIAGILAGRIKISQEEVAALSRLEHRTLQRAACQLEYSQGADVSCWNCQRERNESPLSIKDMPAFDPDAEITSLTLTIPSWNGSINRMRSRVRLSTASQEAKINLKQALEHLQGTISSVLSEIGEM